LDRLVDAAAAYIAPIRDASGPVARVRAAAVADGARALMTLLASLPVEQATFSLSPAGDELRRWFRPDRRLPVDRAPVALLALPPTQRDYLQGRSRQALRTNLSRAASAGLKALVIDSPAELAQAAEHIAGQRGTTASALVPLQVCGDIRPRVWVAYDGHGSPIGLSQTVQEGSWAGLATLVTAPGHPHAQTARYLLHSQVVEDLIDRQVSRLVVGGSILLTTAGTRYFQRRNGYRPVWMRFPR
jgi:hypothetical protein